jgi:UPF0755 protein
MSPEDPMPPSGSTARAAHRAESRGVTRRRRRAIRRLATSLVAVLVVLGVGAAGAVALLHRHHAVSDYPGPGSGSVDITVDQGATATAIGQTLYSDGVVASVGAFTAAAEANPDSTSIEPGVYRMRHRMSAVAALSRLIDPGNLVLGRVTIPEGTSLKVLLPLLAGHTHISLPSLRAAAADPAALGLPSYADGQVEGFLFPATYSVSPGTTAVALLRVMVARFDQAASAVDLVRDAATLHRTPLQVVILASILEGESAGPADDPMVAEVFYNRLRAGMPLGSEFTAVYSGNDPSSPYNTYYHHGWPPGAYDSPGQVALEAALHPRPSSYLYFVTLPSGTTLFETTQAGFLAAQAQCVDQGGCK